MQEFIKESKKIIQRSIYNNKLVLFIGAGVSANSGLPLWKDLIEKISIKSVRCLTNCKKSIQNWNNMIECL